MLFGGATYTGSAEMTSPDQLLKHYKSIPILTGDMMRFYIESYLLK